ncbi:Mannan endo-1,4-beta-mannosidase [Fusarium keratoplasticum]|nr:Mannan endo-1,4-beta-mannosidase [Fusarium keratoplasticum]
MSHPTSDDDVEQAMPQIADSGLKVTRVWAFGNTNSGTDQPVYFQFLDTAKKTITINTGANGIARLYAAVTTAEKHSIHLVLPMLNNWGDRGSIKTYRAYFGWTHAEAQQAYKDYVTFIVDRYKDSPTIFSWQLYNEAPVLGYAYSFSEGIDFEANLKIPTLDYGTVHIYPIGWSYTYPWGDQWIRDHAALALKYSKPIVLEEYGVESTTSNRTAVLKEWQQTILDSDNTYDSFWQFVTNFPNGANTYDDYAIFYGT